MSFFFISCILLAVLHYSATSPVRSNPHEIIPYKVLKKTDNYEVRFYDLKRKMIETSIGGGTGIGTAVQKKVYKKFIDYIHGKNNLHDANVKIAFPRFDAFCPDIKEYKTLIFFPKSVGHPPTPLDGDMHVFDMPQKYVTTFYTSTLTGSPTQAEIESGVKRLQQALQADGVKLLNDWYIAAKYTEKQRAEKVDILIWKRFTVQ